MKDVHDTLDSKKSIALKIDAITKQENDLYRTQISIDSYNQFTGDSKLICQWTMYRKHLRSVNKFLQLKHLEDYKK